MYIPQITNGKVSIMCEIHSYSINNKKQNKIKNLPTFYHPQLWVVKNHLWGYTEETKLIFFPRGLDSLKIFEISKYKSWYILRWPSYVNASAFETWVVWGDQIGPWGCYYIKIEIKIIHSWNFQMMCFLFQWINCFSLNITFEYIMPIL